MTEAELPYDDICRAVAAHPGDRSDGGLRAVFLDEHGIIRLTVGFDEGTGCVDELFLRHLVAVVSELAVAAVVFAVVRSAGRPARVDKLLWRELSTRLADSTTRLGDVIVLGSHRRWSARSGHSERLGTAA
jgi:hypothetical protein